MSPIRISSVIEAWKLCDTQKESPYADVDVCVCKVSRTLFELDKKIIVLWR